MIFSQINSNPGSVTSISIQTEYVSSPLEVFSKLTRDVEQCLLLESAEISSKDNLKSLMLINSAVTFQCDGQSVSCQALNNNGLAIVNYLYEIFTTTEEYKAACTAVLNTEQARLNLQFIINNDNINEDQRLKQVNSFEVLRAAVNQISSSNEHPFAVFLGGAFAYDMIANFESIPSVPDGDNTCPDYVFYLAETMVVIDHQNKTTELVGNVFSGKDAYACCFDVGMKLEAIKNQIETLTKQTPTTEPQYGFNLIEANTDVEVDISDETFKQSVVDLKNHIIQGDIFQVVPSRTFSLDCDNSIDAYRHLKKDNPSPYMFYLKAPEFVLFGASPESSLKYCQDSNQVEIYPIAGTRKRGFNLDGSINLDLDSRNELNLRNDKKEIAEHIMLVDLARNDVARISESGTRHVKELLNVDRYSYVMHLVSRVVGKLRPDLDALHAYQACMNMGTLVGAPKIKASALIREVEKKRRGSYGGAVGYINGVGDMDTCIVIRSAFVTNNKAFVQAGAGVVFDSDPQSEADETRSKAQAVIKAIKASQALAKSQSQINAQQPQ